MPSRRAVLASFAVVPLTGCTEAGPGAPRSEPTSDRTESTPVATPDAENGTAGQTEASDGTETDQANQSRGPVRATNDADVTTRVVEDDEAVEYLAESNQVRYVAAWRRVTDATPGDDDPPEREPVYERSSWERWSRIQCVSAASDAAVDHVRSELDVGSVSGAVSSAVEGEDLAAVVTTSTTLDRAGDVVSAADVDFETLRETAPRRVRATYVLGDTERTMTVPIYVRHVVVRQE